MNYPRQGPTMIALYDEAKRTVRDRMETPAGEMATRAWLMCRDDIIAFSTGVWAEGTSGRFLLPRVAGDAKRRILHYAVYRLKEFRSQLVALTGTVMRDTHRLSYLLQSWILDSITPPNIKVVPKMATLQGYRPAGRARAFGKKEAWQDEPPKGTPDTNKATGEQTPSYEHRIDRWLKGYSQYMSAAVSAGMVGMDSPDALGRRLAQVGAPEGISVADVLKRLVQTQVNISVVDGIEDVAKDWAPVITRRIWQTMLDGAVCPLCAENQDKVEDEWTANIPAHPWCRCWPRVVPVDWRTLAGSSAMPGADPDEMVVIDPATGKPLALMRFTFDRWIQTFARG